MKKLLLLLALCLLAVGVCSAQGVRLDLGGPIAGVDTISTGPIPYLVALTQGVTMNWCQYPANSIQGSACTNYAQSFTDLTLTTQCPSTQPIVLQNSNVCQTQSDPLGNLGVYAAAGTYTYTLTYGNITYGPFVVTLGGAGSGGAIVRINGVNQTITNFNSSSPAVDSGFVAATIKTDTTNTIIEVPNAALDPTEFCKSGTGIGSTFKIGFQNTTDPCLNPAMSVLQQPGGGIDIFGPATIGDAYAQNGINIGSAFPLKSEVATCSSGPIVSGTLVKFGVNGSNACLAPATTSDSTNIEGIAVSDASAQGAFPGHTAVARVGQAACVFDGATTAGDHVIESVTGNGLCHDTGSTSVPPGDVGIVQSTNVGAGTYAVRVASGSGGGSSGLTGVVASQGLSVLGNNLQLIQTCTDTQILSYDGTLHIWKCTNPVVGTGNTTSTSLTTGFLSVANGANSIINSLVDQGITTANVLTIATTAGVNIAGSQGLITGPFGALPATPGASRSGIVFGTSGVIYMSFNNDAWTPALRQGGVAGSDVTSGTLSTSVVPDIGNTYGYMYQSGTNWPGMTGDCTVAPGLFVVSCAYTNPNTTLGDVAYGGVGGVNTRRAGPTGPNGVPQVFNEIPAGGLATAPQFSLPGVSGRAVLGTTASDTILATDCGPKRVEYLTSVNVNPITLPTATTLAVPLCAFKVTNDTSAGNTLTIVPTTWTINGAANLVLAQGEMATIFVDPNSATNWAADITEPNLIAGSGITFGRSQFGGLTINASGGGAPALSSVTGASAQATANETAPGNTWTYNGVETGDKTAPVVWQNTSSNLTNASIGMIVNTAGTATNQVNLVLNQTNASGDFLDMISGGGVTNGVLSGGTNEFAFSPGGIFTANNGVRAAAFSGTSGTGGAVYQGGIGTATNATAGGAQLLGGAITGGTGAAARGGFASVDGGPNAANNLTSQAGSTEIAPGISTNATNQGLQGLLAQKLAYVKGTTATLWNLQCLQTAMKVQDCGASPTNVLGIAETINANTILMTQEGQSPINASAAVTVGDTVCAGSTAGKVTDSGGTGSCTNSQGVQVGVVLATAGAWTLADGVAFTATTTLPLVQLGTGVLATASGGAPAYPVTVTGGISGAVPCFTSTTVESAGTLLAANSPMIGGGAGVCPKTVVGLTFDGTSILTLGLAGTSVGKLALTNATSGSISLATVAGALGAVTASFPANTGNVAELNFAQSWTAVQTFSTAAALGSSTATTQTAKDNSTKVATTAYVDATTPLTAGTSVTLVGPRQYFVCTSTCTITVPVPAAGNEFCVMNTDNVATVITMSAIGSSARYENTARTAYGTAGTGTFISGGAVGDKVCLLGLDSTHYLTASFTGTWTAN